MPVVAQVAVLSMSPLSTLPLNAQLPIFVRTAIVDRGAAAPAAAAAALRRGGKKGYHTDRGTRDSKVVRRCRGVTRTPPGFLRRPP